MRGSGGVHTAPRIVKTRRTLSTRNSGTFSSFRFGHDLENSNALVDGVCVGFLHKTLDTSTLERERESLSRLVSFSNTTFNSHSHIVGLARAAQTRRPRRGEQRPSIVSTMVFESGWRLV